MQGDASFSLWQRVITWNLSSKSLHDGNITLSTHSKLNFCVLLLKQFHWWPAEDVIWRLSKYYLMQLRSTCSKKRRSLRLTLLYRRFFTCLSQRDEETQALKDRIQQRLKKGWDFEDEEEVFCPLISSLRPQTHFRLLLENCLPTRLPKPTFALSVK